MNSMVTPREDSVVLTLSTKTESRGYDVAAFASILNNLNRDFKLWAKEEGYSAQELSGGGIRLAIYSLNGGSIETWLGIAGSVKLATTIFKWASKLRRHLNYMLNNQSVPPSLVPHPPAVNNIAGVVNNGHLTVNNFGGQNFTKEEMKVIRKVIADYLAENYIEHKSGVLLEFVRIDRRQKQRKVDRGVIKEIDDNNYPIWLGKGVSKSDFIEGNANPFENSYEVSVVVKRDMVGEIKYYKILEVTGRPASL